MSEKVSSIDRTKEIARETAEKTTAAAKEGVKKARGKLDELAGVAREGAEKTGRQIKEGASKARDAARQGVDSAKENLRVGYDKARKDLDGLSEDVNEYVRQNPGRSVLIAAGLGFVLGLLLQRRRD